MCIRDRGQSLFGCLCALRQVLPRHPGYHRLFYYVIPVFVLVALVLSLIHI